MTSQRATEAMESYGTSVSNKQSQVINRLTIIAAVFLPLTFLTGFFGMNFQWMIDRLHSLEAFLFLGIGLLVALLVSTLLLFRGRGWLGEKQAGKLEAVATAPTEYCGRKQLMLRTAEQAALHLVQQCLK